MDSLLARPGQRPPSEEVLASLAAIQAARTAAELRLQRDSLRVRLMTMAFLAAFAGGTFALAAHLRARRHPRAATGPVAVATTPVGANAAVPAAAAAPASAAPAPPSEAPLGIDFERGAPTAGVHASAIDAVPGGVGAPGATAPAEPATAAEREQAVATCHDAYDRHRWRAAADACSAAFEASPSDAALAMKAAQSQHARGHYAEAGELARRAIALEDADPEALVILAHAERRARHPAAAMSAYRRYLILAPRGWHAAEARAALHGARAELRARSARRSAIGPSAEHGPPLAEDGPLGR